MNQPLFLLFGRIGQEPLDRMNQFGLQALDERQK
jgi:hypothetical protein